MKSDIFYWQQVTFEFLRILKLCLCFCLPNVVHASIHGKKCKHGKGLFFHVGYFLLENYILWYFFCLYSHFLNIFFENCVINPFQMEAHICASFSCYIILHHYLPTTMVYPLTAWALFSTFKDVIPELLIWNIMKKKR